MNRTGILLICAALIAGCSSNGTSLDTPGGGPTGPSGLNPGTVGQVKITRARVFMREGQPQAFVEGEIGDGCNSLQPMTQQRTGNTIDVTVTYHRQGEVCTMILQLLNQWLPLTGPFAAGDYVLQINAQTIPFRLAAGDTGLRVVPDPGPLPQPPYFPIPQ